MKFKKNIPIVCAAAFLVVSGGALNAAVLLSYSFNTGSSYNATTKDANVTASNFLKNAGGGNISTNTTTSAPATTGNPALNISGRTVANMTEARTTDTTAALPKDWLFPTYEAFNLKANTGFSLNLRNQVVTLLGWSAPSTITRSLFLDVSFDDFATAPIYTSGLFSPLNSPVEYQQGIFTFPDTVAFENIDENTTVSFRLYQIGSTGGGIKTDDITINGSVVPEPSSAALLGLGILSLALRRRR